MRDLDKLRLCAEAVGLKVMSQDCGGWLVDDGCLTVYNPITNSEQAMELLCWLVSEHGGYAINGDMTSPAALRRAIVDAVVKVKEGK